MFLIDILVVQFLKAKNKIFKESILYIHISEEERFEIKLKGEIKMKNEIKAILENEGINLQGISLEKPIEEKEITLALVTSEGIKDFKVTQALLTLLNRKTRSIYFGSTETTGKKVGVILTWQ